MTVGTQFQPVIDDPLIEDSAAVERIYLVAGKFYYELVKARQAKPELAHKVAIIRVEELCPFPYVKLREVLEQYPNAKEIRWAQEEPQNTGAWYHVKERLEETIRRLNFDVGLTYYGARTSAMPAPGSAMAYKRDQAYLTGNLYEFPGLE